MPVLLLEIYINSYSFLQIRTYMIWTRGTRNAGIRIIVTGGLFIQHSLFCCVQGIFLFFFPLRFCIFWVGDKKPVNSKERGFFFSGWVVLGNQSELLLSHNKHWLIDVWQNCLKSLSIIKKEKLLRKLQAFADDTGFLNFCVLFKILKLILSLLSYKIKNQIKKPSLFLYF